MSRDAYYSQVFVQKLTCEVGSSSNATSIVLLLLVAAFAKTLLTAVTFGSSIPAGIFLPSLTIGACVGRAVGLVMDQLHRAHPESWVFSDCPADGGCINPSVYAVIGAAGALGGVTRMTISLVGCSHPPLLLLRFCEANDGRPWSPSRRSSSSSNSREQSTSSCSS